MKYFFITLTLIAILATQAGALQSALDQQTQPESVTGRWRIKVALSGTSDKELIFEAQPGGSGSLLLTDGGLDDKRPAKPVPATWSSTTNNRINFSGEIELKLSPCCLETGTLIFKGKFKSSDSITGKAIFVATTENEESFAGYVSTFGTFTASRVKP